jgi:glutamate-ammonia-ligase adenylyltransferase
MAASVRDVLLAPRLAESQVRSLLGPYGFKDPVAADRNLQAIAEDPTARALLADVVGALLQCLAQSPDPDAALNHLERFVKASGSTLALLSHLRETPRALDVLARTFGSSSFMAEILIRHPAWFYWLTDPEVLGRARTREDVERDLDGALSGLQTESRQRDLLRITRRREVLHIGVRDLLRLQTPPETGASLARLAGALVDRSLRTADLALRRDLGLPPPKEASAGTGSLGFVVLGMGKLGGDDLNFSSDVDLVYVYGTDHGTMARGRRVPNRPDFYKALALRLTAALTEPTAEGYLYRVDLRLRPEGRVGPLAQSLPSCAEYYRVRGATWERLALVKAWPVAGDAALGARFVEKVRPFVYGRPFGPEAVGDVRRIKREIDRKIAARDETHRNVKLGAGGIREIEFVAQTLQARHGRRHSGLRERNTLLALAALRECRLIPTEHHQALVEAYVFLRDVENKLQMVADAQTHALPESKDELRLCALRLGYRDEGGDPGSALLADHRSHTQRVHAIFEGVVTSEVGGSPRRA